MDELLLRKAKGFAVTAHAEQKYGEEPYSVHLEHVADLARPCGEWAEAMAWLHDTVEDTSVTLDDIEVLFGSDARKVLSMLTDEPGHNRKTRKAATNAKLSKISCDSVEGVALVVKACDRLANVRSCSKGNPGLLKMYQREYPEFRAAVFRATQCDSIWVELDQLLGDR